MACTAGPRKEGQEGPYCWRRQQGRQQSSQQGRQQGACKEEGGPQEAESSAPGASHRRPAAAWYGPVQPCPQYQMGVSVPVVTKREKDKGGMTGMQHDLFILRKGRCRPEYAAGLMLRCCASCKVALVRCREGSWPGCSREAIGARER